MIKSIGYDTNTYLKGHEGHIYTITCSKKGDFVATGELLDSNAQACLIVWDFQARERLFRVRYHRQQVLSLTFSCNDTYLISLGGAEDKNQLVCWNLVEGKSECTQSVTEEIFQDCTDVKFYNCDPTKFITGHNGAVKFWMID